MPTQLVLTAIGHDKPGLVEALSTLIATHGGNWLEASLAHLAGKFVGLVRVEVSAKALPALQEALNNFTPLRVVAEIAAEHADIALSAEHLSLELVGHDRIGIIREVSQVLARHQINVESLETWTSAAPMSGEQLFHASAELCAPKGHDLGQLQQDLEALSGELQVDVTLHDIMHDAS